MESPVTNPRPGGEASARGPSMETPVDSIRISHAPTPKMKKKDPHGGLLTSKPPTSSTSSRFTTEKTAALIGYPTTKFTLETTKTTMKTNCAKTENYYPMEATSPVDLLADIYQLSNLMEAY